MQLQTNVNMPHPTQPVSTDVGRSKNKETQTKETCHHAQLKCNQQLWNESLPSQNLTWWSSRLWRYCYGVANRGVSKNKYLLAIWDLETGVERTEWFHVQRDENQWWGKNGLDLHFWQPIIGAKCGNVMCKLCLPNMICFLSMYW